jgi:hypothetical protein
VSNSEFPSNSHADRETRASREKPSEKREVRRVTTGKAVVRKRPLYKKFLDAFRPEDNVGFVEYTLLEVLVPGVKDAMADAIHGTIDNAFGTSSVRSRRRRRGEGGYTSYNRMSEARPRSRREREEEDRRSSRRDSRVADDVREVIFETRVEAEETLDTLIEVASKYEAATMRDLLSMIGEPVNPTHADWGWYDLRGARIHRIGRDGYLLDLPRPEYLD